MIPNLFTPEQIQQAVSLLQNAHHIVLVTHMSPDGDAMGSSLAMRHYLEGQGKEVQVVVPNAFPDFLAWMPGAEKDWVYETQAKEADGILKQADLVICTDFNEPKRIGVLGEKIIALGCKALMIDHHLNPSDFPTLVLSVPAASSTCELVWILLWQMAQAEGKVFEPSKELATCIYTGLMTDTGNFSFNSNRAHLYEIISRLVAVGIDKDGIYNRVFNAYSADRMRLTGYCLYKKMVIFPEHHLALIALSRKELYRFHFQSGDAEGIVNMPLQIKDVYYSCFMREDKVALAEQGLAHGSKIKIKISLRSQGDRPVNILAKELFGGGGHANASGGEYYGPLQEAVDRFVAHYKEYM